MLHIEGWKRVVIWATCALGLLFALPNGFYGQVESYNDAQEAGQEPQAGHPSFRRGWSILDLICVVVRICLAR